MARFDKTELDSKEARRVLAASVTASSNTDSETRCSREALQPRRARYRGISLIWTAITLFTLILFVGIALDAAKIVLAIQHLQNAADAAALAGALLVKTNHAGAINLAYTLGGANYYVDGNSVNLNTSSDIILGNYYPQITDPDIEKFYPISDPNDFANAVKVIARCDGSSNPLINLNFGPIIDIDTVNISRYAIAMSSGGTGAGLIALDCGSPCEDTRPNPCGDVNCSGPAQEGGPGLQLDGGSIVDVGGGPVLGEIVVNCSSCDHPKPAVHLIGNSTIKNAAQMNVVGCYDGPETDYPISENDPCNYMPDPLGCFPYYDCLMPRLSADPDNDLSPAPCEYWEPDVNTIDPNSPDPNFTLWPGYYSGGIKIRTAPYPVIFKPGIYILDGEICSNINADGGLKINGGIIDASGGVMFYILGGSVDIGGNPVLIMNELVPWDASDEVILPYEGMLFYQDPDNCTPARIIGTSDMLLVGTLYFPFNEIEIGGDGYAVGSQLIANSVLVHTSHEGVLINYDGRYRAPGSKSYLVE